MNTYAIFTWALLLIGVVTCPFPLTVPLAALAYKVRLGNRPIPMGVGEFWLRATFAALGLALFTGVFGFLRWLLADYLELPRGIISVVIFLLYVPAGIGYFFWIFAFDELLEALSVFAIYFLLPGLPLALILWLTGWGKHLERFMFQSAYLPVVERFLA